MKTNKRLLLGVCAGLLVGAAALTTASALAPKHPHSDLLLANAEALASNEGGSGNLVTCYSSSRSQSGSTYYDCGSCEKQFNSKGIDDTRECRTK